MQIRGKIFTITGIVLLFGYFIKDSLKDPYDPTQVVMIGNDTLGRDWGAMAEQAISKTQQSQNDDNTIKSISSENESDSLASIASSNDPYGRQKFNQDNYSSILSPDGREIITGYARPEEAESEDNEENGNIPNRIQTRHQKEKYKKQVEEPDMIYRE